MRFIVYLGGVIQGPLNIPEMWELPGFNGKTTVCREGEDGWAPAEVFPEIEHLRYAPPPPPPEVETALSAKKTWRDAIIPADVTDEAYWYKPQAQMVIQSGDVVTASRQKTPAQAPVKVKREFPAWMVRHRKNMLLGVLLTGLIGAYSPQGDSIAAICEGLAGPTGPLPLSMITRSWSGRPRPKAGPWRKAFTAKSIDASSKAKTTTPPVIFEIGSEDLGNGFIEKTIVITRYVDGVQIQETKTKVIPAPKQKARRKKLSKLDTDLSPIS